MRRFFLFSMFIICFLCAGLMKEDFVSMLKSIFTGGEIFAYSSNADNMQLQSKEPNLAYENELQNIKQGDIYDIEVYGETFVTDSENFDLNEFIQGMHCYIVKCENVADREIYYMYTHLLPKYEFIDGKKVNLQISISEKLLVVGYPMIVGSF